MRKARIFMHGRLAGHLVEEVSGRRYRFEYLPDYDGPPVSLKWPVREEPYRFDEFPAFFDGLLPEGIMLEALLRQAKIDRDDQFSQLLAVGHDVVGAATILEAASE